ncbi:MAG: hypothetical protein JWR04_538 [Rhodoglobus sp.]|nr:hypothetical protein [Rhodoglobus sp.]
MPSAPPRRILVAGVVGAGKTSRALAELATAPR